MPFVLALNFGDLYGTNARGTGLLVIARNIR